MKVVVNRCFGGFSLSSAARKELLKKGRHEIEDRTDPDLIAVVEELGRAADGEYAELEIVEIPDDVEWEIDEYDGIETIHEKHRSW